MTAVLSTRVWAAAAAAVGVSLLAVPGVASADPLPAGCTQSEQTGPVTCFYTSGTNELLLPEGVTSVTVTAVGGRGGSAPYQGRSNTGGRGAEVTGTVAIPSGTRTLYAVVGGNGADRTFGSDRTGGDGGANGGGTGGTPNVEYAAYPGAGGGGASDVRTASGELKSRLVVAAGGGGGNYAYPGGDAGASGLTLSGVASQPGTEAIGGAAGTDNRFPGWDGTDGGLGSGGLGGPRDPRPLNAHTGGGGGGGGGLYGGGGGRVTGSGAGGSSLAPEGTTLALSDSAPSVTITYQPPTVTPEPPVCTGSSCLPDGLFGSS